MVDLLNWISFNKAFPLGNGDTVLLEVEVSGVVDDKSSFYIFGHTGLFSTDNIWAISENSISAGVRVANLVGEARGALEGVVVHIHDGQAWVDWNVNSSSLNPCPEKICAVSKLVRI